MSWQWVVLILGFGFIAAALWITLVILTFKSGRTSGDSDDS